MDPDEIGGIAVFVGMLGFLALIARWVQHFRFTAEPGRTVMLAIRWRHGPLGLGWQSGVAKLAVRELRWRRTWSLRRGPHRTYPRSQLAFIGRRWPPLSWSLFIYDCEVLTLAHPGGRVEAAMFSHDADDFLSWLHAKGM